MRLTRTLMPEDCRRSDAGGGLPRALAGRTCQLDLSRPRIMGVLNVTPDSFYDGGRYANREALQRRIAEMVADGADLIDVGGESSRPGAQPVSLDEELDRVVPAIELIVSECAIPVSVDTTKAAVALESMTAGAEFVNDISGLQFDPEMAAAVASSGAGLFLMHTRGRPDAMQENTVYTDILDDIVGYLAVAMDQALAAGVALEKIAVDPGIGFGKSVEGNVEILHRLPEMGRLGRPILLGTSRKSFIGKLLKQDDPEQRLAGTLATIALGVAAGARIFRVHDIRPAREAAEISWAITMKH